MNELFNALSDDTRRNIIELLSEESLTAGEISANFDMSKPAISYHLDILRDAGLVCKKKKGQYMYYSLTSSNMIAGITWLMKFLGNGIDSENV